MHDIRYLTVRVVETGCSVWWQVYRRRLIKRALVVLEIMASFVMIIADCDDGGMDVGVALLVLCVVEN